MIEDTPSALPSLASLDVAALDPEFAAGHSGRESSAADRRPWSAHDPAAPARGRNIELRQDAAQGPSVGLGRAGQRAEIGAVLARVEEDRAAVLHIGVELGESGRRGHGRIGRDRPVDQRKEDDLVLLDIDADRIARLDRGALQERVAETRASRRGSHHRRPDRRSEHRRGGSAAYCPRQTASAPRSGAVCARNSVIGEAGSTNDEEDRSGRRGRRAASGRTRTGRRRNRAGRA